MYEEFISKNPDFKSRIEAFTSGILSPDPKSLTLLSMKEGEAYTVKELYDNLLDFLDLEPDLFPLTLQGVWEYCYRNPTRGYKGLLEQIGAVVKVKVKRRHRPKLVIAYQKTKAGIDFGNAIVAIGTRLVNDLDKLKLRYKSLWKLLGAAQKPSQARRGRGSAVYEITKLLAENPDTEFRMQDIVEELKDLDYRVISAILNSSGEAGAIHYESPHRDEKGRRTKGWALYQRIEPIDYEDALAEIRRIEEGFRNIGHLKQIVNYINQNPGEGYERNKLAKKHGIHPHSVSRILSLLARIGYLNYKFSGRKVQSLAKANEATKLIWKSLELIERVALNLNPHVTGFFDCIEAYQSNPKEWREAMIRQLYIYDEERSHHGRIGGVRMRKIILEVMPIGKRFKLSHVKERTEKKIGRKISSPGIHRCIKNLVRSGKIIKVGRGFYQRIE